MSNLVFEIDGYCAVCETNVRFRAERDAPLPVQFYPNWFRNDLKCQKCGCLPRERAIAHVLNKACPDWRKKDIHESSPGGRGLSPKLRRECPGYVTSQYEPDLEPGETHPKLGWRNEDLENQTFADESFDVVLTQDVFEHLFNPGIAAREIARTLRPGGICVMTVPVVDPWGEIKRRASLKDGEIIHHLEEQYHGNPVADGRSLVTVDWSYQIGAYLSAHSGMGFAVMDITDMEQGIRDSANVVLYGKKSPLPDLGEGALS